ncbi:MAG: LytTR family DNA-binding domain-containing protein [Betaproteobacteria bacterium]
MATVRAVIAEDEPVLREELAELLVSVWPTLEIVAQAADGIAAVAAVEQFSPAVLFLDIQMPRMTGLEVARQVGSRCHIVFLTAYDQYAVEAFEQGAIDYVLKPVTAKRLMTSMTRLQQRLSNAPSDLGALLARLEAAAGVGRQYLRWIKASRGNAVRLITVEEILYFKADAKYTLVMTADGESLIRTTIKELASELNPNMFWQVHRSAVVNVNAIESVVHEISGATRVRLKNHKEVLPVSEPYQHLFRSM